MWLCGCLVVWGRGRLEDKYTEEEQHWRVKGMNGQAERRQERCLCHGFILTKHRNRWWVTTVDEAVNGDNERWDVCVQVFKGSCCLWWKSISILFHPVCLLLQPLPLFSIFCTSSMFLFSLSTAVCLSLHVTVIPLSVWPIFSSVFSSLQQSGLHSPSRPDRSFHNQPLSKEDVEFVCVVYMWWFSHVCRQ